MNPYSRVWSQEDADISSPRLRVSSQRELDSEHLERGSRHPASCRDISTARHGEFALPVVPDARVQT